MPSLVRPKSLRLVSPQSRYAMPSLRIPKASFAVGARNGKERETEMPTKSERAKVEVKESSTLDTRCFNITFTAPVSDFQLTDLLRQRGVINGLDSELKLA